MPRVNKRTRRSLARGVEFVASRIYQYSPGRHVSSPSICTRDGSLVTPSCASFFSARAKRKHRSTFFFAFPVTQKVPRNVRSNQVHRIFPLNSGGPPRAGLRPSGKPELFHSNHSGHTGSIFLNGRSRARVAYWGHRKKTNKLIEWETEKDVTSGWEWESEFYISR